VKFLFNVILPFYLGTAYPITQTWHLVLLTINPPKLPETTIYTDFSILSRYIDYTLNNTQCLLIIAYVHTDRHCTCKNSFVHVTVTCYRTQGKGLPVTNLFT